jgi:serine/threonine protein kinase
LSSLYEQHESDISAPIVIPNCDLDYSNASILGSGAGGTTRKVFWSTKNQFVAVKSFESMQEQQQLSTTQPNRRMTSDGRPEHEALVFFNASACTSHHDPPTVVQVLGQTPLVSNNNNDDDAHNNTSHNPNGLVMEYLHNYIALADPPSMESCTRDVYFNQSLSLTLAQATTLLTRLMQAQVDLHKAGICHGDFYGHNILMQRPEEHEIDGQTDDAAVNVRLSDFGAAFFYDITSDWGKCLHVCELRALGVLVQEILALVCRRQDGGNGDNGSGIDIDGTSSNNSHDLLEQLAAKCSAGATGESFPTFDSIAIWWKQQQLKSMAKALDDELLQ